MGDFANHAEVITLIKKYFSPWARTADDLYGHLPRYAPVPAPVDEPFKILLFSDPELTRASLDLGWIGEKRSWAPTPRTLRARMTEDLVSSVFYDRMNRIVEESGEAPPFVFASLSKSAYEGASWIEWDAGLRDDSQWPEALGRLLEEAWRLVLHGVSALEIEVPIDEMRTSLNSAFAERHMIESKRLADRFQQHFLHDDETTSHVDDSHRLRVQLALLDTLDPKEASEYARLVVSVPLPFEVHPL